METKEDKKTTSAAPVKKAAGALVEAAADQAKQDASKPQPVSTEPGQPGPDASDPGKAAATPVITPAKIGGDPAGPQDFAPRAEASPVPTATNPNLATTTVETAAQAPARAYEVMEPAGVAEPAVGPYRPEIGGNPTFREGDDVTVTIGDVKLDGKVSGASYSGKKGLHYEVDVHHADANPTTGQAARTITLTVPGDVVGKAGA